MALSQNEIIAETAIYAGTISNTNGHTSCPYSMIFNLFKIRTGGVYIEY
jgi:hypothetical protein